MSEIDLDRLGDVWRQQPDPREMEDLKRSAEAVGKRARWGQRLDVVASVVVAGVVLFLALSSPTRDTLVVGGGAILILLASHVRSRRLRSEELRALTGTSEEMLDQSINSLRATLKRARLQLVLLIPGLAIGLLIAFLVDDRSSGEVLRQLIRTIGAPYAVGIVAAISLGALSIHMIALARRTRQELARLVALRDTYRQESESTLTGTNASD